MFLIRFGNFCFWKLASSFGTKSEGYKLCRPATKTFSGIKMFRKKSSNVMIGECYRKGRRIFYLQRVGQSEFCLEFISQGFNCQLSNLHYPNKSAGVFPKTTMTLPDEAKFEKCQYKSLFNPGKCTSHHPGTLPCLGLGETQSRALIKLNWVTCERNAE